MRNIYCKSTEKRRREFQIYTRIVEESGERRVIKKAVFPEGQPHIEKIVENHKLLYKIYGEKIVSCVEIAGQVQFPFVFGDNWQNRLKSEIKKDGDIKKSLMKWKRILIGDENNIVKFEENKEFNKIFGDGTELNGDMALRVTNFDCSGENIILSSEGPKLIDYEWVFPFPIPLELTFYRVLKLFYTNNKKLIDFNKLLLLADINGNKINIYEKMMERFYSYVNVDEVSGVNYANLGKIFKTEKVLIQNAGFQMPFKFPFHAVKPDSGIILYGAGDVGMGYYNFINMTRYCNIESWVDEKYEQYQMQGFPVKSIDSIKNFDLVLVAIYKDEIAHEIIDKLQDIGISRDKIIWEKPEVI